MSDQTTSSIVIAAEPSAVMEVIGDFPAYPEWATGVKKADVVAEGPEGWAEFRETGWSRPANVCPLHARAMHHQDSAANYLAPALLIEPYGEGVSSE